MNAFNPCAPNHASRTCDDYKPFYGTSSETGARTLRK